MEKRARGSCCASWGFGVESTLVCWLNSVDSGVHGGGSKGISMWMWLYIINGTTGRSADEHLSLTNQDLLIEINASITAACVPW